MLNCNMINNNNKNKNKNNNEKKKKKKRKSQFTKLLSVLNFLIFFSFYFSFLKKIFFIYVNDIF